MYESPIEVLCGEIQTKIIEEEENQICKVVRDVGVRVDKEELVRALKYDRGQYEKGYAEGYRAAIDKVMGAIESIR